MAKIQITISAENAQAITALKQVAETARQTGDSVKKAGGGIGFGNVIKSAGGFLDKLSKITIVGAGIVAIFHEIKDAVAAAVGPGFGFNKSMEQNQLGMAGILQSMTLIDGKAVDFNQAMAISSDMMNKLQKDALRTAASTEDLVEVFRAILAPGFNAGMTLDQIRQLATVGTNAIKSLGVPAQQVVQEMRDLVQGGITAAGSTLATALGITDADIAKAKNSSEGLFKFLMDRMQGFSETANRFPDTMSGKMDQLGEMWTMVSAKFSSEFAEPIKEGLQSIADMAGTVNAETGEFEINPDIVSIIDKIKNAFSELRQFIINIQPTIDDVEKAVVDMYEAIKPLLLSIADLFDKCGPPVIRLIDTMARIVSGVAPALQAIMNKIAEAIGYVADNASRLIDKLAALALAYGAVEGALLAVRAAMWAVGKITVFATMIETAYGAAKAINSIGSAVDLLGLAFQKLSKRNIVLTLLSVAGILWGDKLVEWAQKVAGSDSAYKPAVSGLADFRRSEDTNTKPPVNSFSGNAQAKYPPVDKEAYEKANKQADIALESEKGRLAEVVAILENQIREINAKTEAGIQLSLEEQAKLAAIKLQIAQEKLNSNEIEKSIISDLYASDADGSHNAEIDKKIASLNTAATSLQSAIDEAQKSFDQLQEVIVQFGSIAGGTASGINAFGQAIIKAGEEQLGLQYQMGGDGVYSTDCGEFTLDTFKKVGINLADRLANDQYDQYAKAGAIKNDLSQAKPGDLLFFYYPGTQEFAPGETLVGHVGIYAGENRMLHASSSKGAVSYTGIDVEHLVGIGDTGKLTGRDLGSDGSYAQKASQFKKLLESSMEGVTEAKAKALKFGAEMLQKAAEVEAQYQEMLGNTTEKAYLDIEQKYDAMKQSLKPGGATMELALKKIDKMIAIEKNRADFSQQQKNLEFANNQLVTTQESLLNDLASGAKTAAEVTDEYVNDYWARMQPILNNLQRQLEAALKPDSTDRELADKIRETIREINNKLGDFFDKIIQRIDAELQDEIAMINADRSLTSMQKQDKIDEATRRTNVRKVIEYEKQAQELREADKREGKNKHATQIIDLEKSAALYRELSKLPSLLDKVHEASKQAFEDGLLDFLERGIIECKNLGEAFRNLAITVLQSIQKIYSQEMTRRIMNKLGLGVQSQTPTSVLGTTASNGFYFDPNFGIKFAEGGSTIDSGLVKGPGTSVSDSILAWVQNIKKWIRIGNGEWIMKGEAVRKYGTRIMDAINSGRVPVGMLQQYAVGGSLTDRSGDMDLPGPQELTANLSNDTTVPVSIMNVFDQEMVPRLMQSRRGRKAIINVINENKTLIKHLLK